jgi:pimeloyl-ACP methyl ester carboxylesterase
MSGMIEQPALFIAAQRDTVGVPALQLNMTLPFSPALQIRTVDAGHFVHIEKAEEVNKALHGFFESLQHVITKS